jgi:imidazolonepropionase-like amidohydrolase
MVGQWASDERLRKMSDDPRMVYLPQGQKDRWLSLEKNPYQEAGFPFKPEEIDANYDVMALLLQDFRDAGVPFLLSTDSFGTLLPGFSVHQELQLMVKAGLSPYEALRSGTVNVAAFLGEDKVAGTIEVGKRADFILVDGNPLRDVANASLVRGVFTHGEWYGESELARLLSDARKIVQPN